MMGLFGIGTDPVQKEAQGCNCYPSMWNSGSSSPDLSLKARIIAMCTWSVLYFDSATLHPGAHFSKVLKCFHTQKALAKSQTL